MTVMERLARSVVVPVVVLEKVEDAVPLANAMAAGGVDTMEITFRTACAPECIKAVAENCPDVLVGAGTIVNLDQCKLAIEMGAKFIVSPGFSDEIVGYCVEHGVACAPECIKAVAENCPDVLVGAGTIVNLDQCKLAIEMGAKFIVSPGFSDEIVGYCVEHGVAVAPGCVTPTEIMAAMKHGLKMVKFFPANVYGGLKALKNLAAPFGSMKFLPTGGVNNDNIKEFIDTPFIHAVGGSWVCPKADVVAGNWDKITELCKSAHKAAKGE